MEQNAKMSIMAAIKRFMETGGNPPCSGRELIEFKKACTEEEWLSYGQGAAKALNVQLDTPA
jgi:hypothetical protein